MKVKSGDERSKQNTKPTPSSPYYISAKASILERRPRTLKHNDTFAVFDHYGDIASGEGSAQGIFHKDTRYLSLLRVLLDEHRPLLLSSTVQDNNATLTADLTNPDFYRDGRLVMKRDTIHVARSKFLWKGACYERLGVRNFDQVARRIGIAFRFAADFADIFELRGHDRKRRGQTGSESSESGVIFSYHGLDGIVRKSAIRFDPAPDRLDQECARFSLVLQPDERVSLFMNVTCEEGERDSRPARRFFVGMRDARRAQRALSARVASVETSNQIFNEELCRAVADLRMLMTETKHGPFPYAGIPWFSTPFGRDALITAIEMLWIDPAVAKGVLHFLAATQATEVKPEAEAEPGKILHEMRNGELARLGEVPFACYYGSVDTTPLFVILAGRYFERTGDLETVQDLWPHIDAALQWIDSDGDRDHDGFVEYQRAGKNGLVNQGWKDSDDSVFHADGAIAQGAIALCEVQGYVFLAKRLAAKVAAASGDKKRSAQLLREAEELRVRFEGTFWCEDMRTYALALDGDKKLCRVRASNAGQLLFSGIAAKDRAKAVADQLMGPAFFTGWGIRTIAASEARYNPMSYHNGSVWPHDNALIGLGFARYGLRDHTCRLMSALYDLSRHIELRRLPELICGLRRSPGKGPTLYPVACVPQAWSSAAPLALLEACLGLEFEPGANEPRFRQPSLPDQVDTVTIRSLPVGEAQVDVVVRRHGPDVAVKVLTRA